MLLFINEQSKASIFVEDFIKIPEKKKQVYSNFIKLKMEKVLEMVWLAKSC